MFNNDLGQKTVSCPYFEHNAVWSDARFIEDPVSVCERFPYRIIEHEGKP
jgi:hypothetical protein